ncbi:MAG: FHA domain-containing protein [Streptosporangiaceae bacterium]
MTTTHDPHGGGHPRLILALGGLAEAHSAQREFPLFPGTTTVGSAADADVRLIGLEHRHAEVRRDGADEYVYCDLGSSAGSRVDGQPVGEWALHTGDRIEIGRWILSYYRDEFADHGRPYGGREGGGPYRPPRPEPRPAAPPRRGQRADRDRSR